MKYSTTLIFFVLLQSCLGQFLNSKCPELARNQTLDKVKQCFEKQDQELTTNLISGTKTLQNLLCTSIQEKVSKNIPSYYYNKFNPNSSK